MRASRLLPCALILILGPLLFSSSGRDDSYITYGAARALVTDGEILNYNGARVEQSSSLLHVILLAVTARVVPLPLASLGPLLSLSCGALAVFLTYRLGYLLFAPAALPAALLAACTSSLLYWSASGMESTLAACVTVWLILVAYRWLWKGRGSYVAALGALLSFLSVRPENVFVLAATGAALAAHVWLRGPHVPASSDAGITEPRRTPGAFIGITLGALGALVTFRMLYFHSAFPQPVYAKGGLSFASLMQGLGYLGGSALLRPTAPLWIICAAAVVRTLRRSRVSGAPEGLELLLSCFVVAYVAFVACAGGDWMEAGRFLVPVLPVVIAMSVAALWRATTGRLRVVATVLLAILLLSDTALLFRSPQNFGGPLWRHLYRNQGNDRAFSWFEQANELHAGYTDLIPALQHVVEGIRVRKGGAAVSVLTGEMGMVPYHIVERSPDIVQWVDMFGLTDRSVTTCPATRDLPRGPRGIMMRYDEFFRHRTSIRSACDFADPDVIFERAANRDFEQVLNQNGYVVVFLEKKRWLQWIAVRQDLS